MLYQPKNPVGYKNLLTWKQAGEIYHKTKDFTSKYLDKMNDRRLLGHMNDSARSVQRNIEEGYKRATTKEYINFLGFSRASLEELKNDFEELKREYREGIRRDNKGKEGNIGENKGRGREGERRMTGNTSPATGNTSPATGNTSPATGNTSPATGNTSPVIGGTSPYIPLSSPIPPSPAIRKIEGLLDLIYGEDCMLGRQIASLEKKMVKEKTLPRNIMIKRAWESAASRDKRFWKIAKDNFGIEKDEKGIIRRIRENKGLEGKDKGLEGKDRGLGGKDKGLEGKDKGLGVGDR